MRFGSTVAAAAVLALASFAAAGAQAPAPAPDIKTFASSADVQALIANARKIHKPGEPTVIQPLLLLAPYRASLEYRTSVGPAAVHEKEAEFFYVIDGSGTLVTGGKLAGEKRQNPTNLGGTGIDGGQAREVAKGDFIVVPENTPHWFSAIKGELVLMSLHVPRG
jgi:mannose-6-phosphate isomerase-like protein (cupin superfamily)